LTKVAEVWLISTTIADKEKKGFGWVDFNKKSISLALQICRNRVDFNNNHHQPNLTLPTIYLELFVRSHWWDQVLHQGPSSGAGFNIIKTFSVSGVFSS